MKRHTTKYARGETAVCISCLAEINPSEPFCPACGAPVGTTAALDPVKSISAQRFVISRALEGRPRLSVLVCFWMLNLPVVVGGVLGAIYVPLQMDAFSGFLIFWFLVGLAILSGIILYRITKNYITLPEKRWDEDE